MIEYKVETLDTCLEEMKPLLHKHYLEVALYQDKIEFNPDYDKYYTMEEMGMLHIVTVRDDGNLIGYFISMINENIHYSDHTYALNDVLYVDEDYRNSGVGQTMFDYAEAQLENLGVSVIIIHMKTEKPFDSLCENLDYDYAERIYTKYIGN